MEVLVATGEGRKDAATRRLSGRARDGRLVHFGPGDLAVRPGDVVTVEVTYGAPHHLVADGPVRSHGGPAPVTRTRPGRARPVQRPSWVCRASARPSRWPRRPAARSGSAP